MISIGVVSNDFRFLYLIKDALKNVQDTKIIHIPSNEIKSEKDIDVYITTESYRNKINSSKIFVPKSFNSAYLYSNILAIKESKKRFKSLTIGIDPGKTIGMAAILDEEDIIFNANTFSHPVEVVKEIIMLFFNVEVDEFNIKIGNGGKTVRDEIIKRLKKIFQNKVEIKIVDEKNTSKFSNKSLRKQYNKHIVSAIKIAKLGSNV